MWCALDFKISFIFFQIHRLNIEIHTLRSDSNNVSIYLIFFFSLFHAKVLDYRAVGLLSRQTIEMHPSEYIYKFLCPRIYVVHVVYKANGMYDHCMAICKKLNILSRCWYECQDEIMIDVLLVLCCKQYWLNDVLYNKTEEFVHIFLLSVNKWYPMILFFIMPKSSLHACLYQIWHETKYSYSCTYTCGLHVFVCLIGVFIPLENF